MMIEQSQQIRLTASCDLQPVQQSIVFNDLDTGGKVTVNLQQVDDFFADYQYLKATRKSNWNKYWQQCKSAKHQLFQYAELGKIQEIVNLVNSGIPLDLDDKGLDDWTAVHLAAMGNQPSVILYLMGQKCNINALTRYKRNAAHIAAVKGHIEVLKVLAIAYQQQFLCEDCDNNTPLHLACINSNVEIIEYLLTLKHSLKRNSQQLTPYQICTSSAARQIFIKLGMVNDQPTQKVQIEGHIVTHTRADYVKRFLNLGNFRQVKIADTVKLDKAASRLSKRLQKLARNISTYNMDITQVGPQDFQFYKLLGKGSFGEVYLASLKSDPLKKKFAIKILEKQKVFSKNLVRYATTQRNVLKVLNHPFIVKLHYAFQNQDKLFLVLDYCPGGDLGQLIQKYKKFPQDTAKLYIAQIILAFQELHKREIVFRDLKPENVVIDQEGHAQLTDFGLSKQQVNNKLTYSFCGSVAYLAPQVLLKQGHSRTVDWYLVGLLLYQLCVGQPPFYNSNKDILFQNIKNAKLKLPKSMSQQCKQIIIDLLCRDPNKRLGAMNDAQEIKSHRFFNGLDWQLVLARKLKVPKAEPKRINLQTPLKLNFLQGKGKQRLINGWTFMG